MSLNKIQPVDYYQALEKVLQNAAKFSTTTEFVALHDTLNRVLAVDINSDLDIPGANNSSMDGYCVRSNDTIGANRALPVTLPLVDGIDAGHTIESLPPGHCAYIATGGVLPPGADTVIRIEDTALTTDCRSVQFYTHADRGRFVRVRASELKCGQLMIKAGTLITPQIAGQIAAAGQTIIKAIKKPTVAILTSGDEILMPWETPQPWQVRNSNSTMLIMQCEEAGAKVFDLGIARDIGTNAKDMFLRAIECADIVVTSGGISMGRKDPFKQVFSELAIEPVFYGVAIKPGKPVFFGYFQKKPVFALPGNQVSTSVTFELFVRPFIRKAQGLTSSRLALDLELTDASLNDSGRDFFKRGQLENRYGRLMVKPLESQESHMLSSLAGAEILFLHPAEAPHLAAGEKVRSFFLKG